MISIAKHAHIWTNPLRQSMSPFLLVCVSGLISEMNNQSGNLFLGEDNSSSLGRYPLVANRSLGVKCNEHYHLLQTMH